MVSLSNAAGMLKEGQKQFGVRFILILNQLAFIHD